METYLQKGLAKGHFAVILSGNRFQGEYLFHRMQDQSWLLLKKETKPIASVKMPTLIHPMLATLIKEPFSDPL
jgi:bifunctional non-homologous end joining protein LigD